MQMLQSAMAFAVAMILFSTIVTGIVELILRLAGLREKNLRSTLDSLFEMVIWPRMKARLMTIGSESESAAKERLRTQFVNDMTDNPALPPVPVDSNDDAKKHAVLKAVPAVGAVADLGRKLPSMRHAGKVSVLTPLAFAERLGRTDVGKAILAEGEAQLELLIQDFVRTFDRFGRAASEVFRKNAQLTAICVGIAFAIFANVEAGRLFTTLMNNPDLRDGLISQANEAAEANQAALDSLAKITEQIDAGRITGEEAEELKKQAEKIQADIRKALDKKGLPIGYAYYPYCGEGPDGVSTCADPRDEESGLLKFLKWLLLTVLAGILIGLGGPFWFRVFSSLSQVFQVLRAFGLGSKPQQAKPEEVAASPSAEDSAKPKDISDAFKVAAKVHAHGATADRRLLLGPDGQPL